MDILEKILGSAHRAKVMKLFLFNPTSVFDSKTVSTKVKAREKEVRKELSLLQKINFLKNKDCRNASGRKVNGWTINLGFKYIDAVRDFLMRVSPFSSDALVRKLGESGRIKLVVVAGVFLNEFDTRVDLLVVGDKIKKNIFEKIMKEIEAEMGREIHYALLESADFEYRLGVGDKLIRDIFDYKHEVIYNKIGLVG
jgi:hypothetical protein